MISKGQLINFLKKRYSLPVVNQWRVVTFALWVICMFAFFLLCDAYMTAYNINFLAAWLLKLAVMGLTFEICFTLSDSLQTFYLRKAEVWGNKIAHMKSTVSQAKNKKSTTASLTKTRFVILILLLAGGLCLINAYVSMVFNGINPILAFFLVSGLLFMLSKAAGLMFLLSDYHFLENEKNQS